MKEDEKKVMNALYELQDNVTSPEAIYIVEILKTTASNSFTLVNVHDLNAK